MRITCWSWSSSRYCSLLHGSPTLLGVAGAVIIYVVIYVVVVALVVAIGGSVGVGERLPPGASMGGRTGGYRRPADFRAAPHGVDIVLAADTLYPVREIVARCRPSDAGTGTALSRD